MRDDVAELAPTMTHDAVGPVRLGNYELLARIATGGMAEIFVARQRDTQTSSRLVVIKRILPQLARERRFVRMFMREARHAALINHPNVVQIYDLGQVDGAAFIAMEHVAGLSLLEALNAHPGFPLPVAIAAEIVAQACDGLHAAHELRDERGRALGLIHRDVSPQNLMITPNGRVVLLDFGIAKSQDCSCSTHAGQIKGKLPYLSPEQFRGEQLDRRTDIFSLGIVFHELVVGRGLFHRGSTMETFRAIVEEPIDSPSGLRREIPQEISALVMRCLARKPADRFASAADLGRAIRAALRRHRLKVTAAHLADHVNGTYGDLLRSRSAAIRRLSRATPPPVSALPAPADAVLLADGQMSSWSATSTTTKVEAPAWMTAERRRQRRFLRLALFVATVALGLGVGRAVGDLCLERTGLSGPPITLGLPPSFPPEVGHRELQPFLSYLERRLGRPVELVVASSYEELRAMVLAGKLHFANLPPLQFVISRQQHPRLRALVTSTYEGAHRYQAFVVARDDVPINSLSDLRGKRFCYVDPGSASGYLMPRHFLRQRGLDPDRLFAEVHFSGDHLSVMRDLLAGRCDAGAIYSIAMISAPRLGVAGPRIRLVAVAGQVPYDVFCAADGVPAEVAGALRRALLQLRPERDLRQRILGPTFRIDGFVEPHLPDYAGLARAARSEGLLAGGPLAAR